jgi:hypothetical protein
MIEIKDKATIEPDMQPNSLLISFQPPHAHKIFPRCRTFCRVNGCGGIQDGSGRVRFVAPPEQENKPLPELFVQAACGLVFEASDQLSMPEEGITRPYSFEVESNLSDIANYAGDSVNYATEASDRLEELTKQRQRR